MSFSNAKIIGTGLSRTAYPDGKRERGDPLRSISQSDLQVIIRNPHKWRFTQDGDDEQTEAMKFGSLVDYLLFTPAKFAEDYAVKPETYTDAKTGEVKPWRANAGPCVTWLEEHEGANVISEKQLVKARKAIKALQADADVAAVLTGAQFQSIIVADYTARNGLVIPVCGLTDIIHPGLAIADLKTFSDASADGWGRRVFRDMLHFQGAFYLDIYNATPDGIKAPLTTFLHIAVEPVEPFEIGRRQVSEELLSIGRGQYKQALDLYAECIKSGQWKGYDEPGCWTMADAEPWMMMQTGKAAMRDQFAELCGQ